MAALHRYKILDTDPETDFDEVVRVLSEVCDMPISPVSLVDKDRQWFKAKVGVGPDVTEMPIEQSVCAHGILQPDLLEIRDMTRDFRTIDNPIVTGDPKVRFYASAALITRDGLPLGMLCMLDYKPRELTTAQRDLLQVMAKMVMHQIEMRRSLKEEREARLMVQTILEQANGLLAQNATLRQEVDHRVKNSLQQVAAFLRIQERGYKDEPKIARPLAEARNRVMTVASVHDHLHKSAKDDKASVAQFLTNLAQAISGNRSDELKAIEVDADDTRLASDKVMTLGLTVNEIVSNAMKHAFRTGHDGVVRVSFRSEGDTGVLHVTDNGIGLPHGFDPSSSSGLGMKVLGSLAQQLGGKLDYETGAAGTGFTIRFPLSVAA